MPLITSYSFGNMIVDGMSYNKDVLIYPDSSILSPWWRIAGHRLELADVEKMIQMRPEIIIAGTGASGMMRPSVELQSTLLDQRIEFVALPTKKAVDVYNELSAKKRTGGCFHLTC